MKNEDKGVSRIAAPGDGYRWQQTGYIGDDVFTVYLLGVRFDSNHRLLPSTTIKSIMTGGVSTVDSSIRCHSLRPSIILRQRSQLSAALTLISQLSNKSKCISINPFVLATLTPHYPKQRRVLTVKLFCYAVYEENPFTNVTPKYAWK